MVQYEALAEEDGRGVKRSSDSRARFIVGAIVFGVVCVVGVIVGTTSGRSSTGGSNNNAQSSGPQAQAVTQAQTHIFGEYLSVNPTRPKFGVHPILGGLHSTGVVSPFDPTVVRHVFEYKVNTYNHRTHLRYDAEVVRDTIVLSNNTAALELACLASQLLVNFSSAEAALNFSRKMTAQTLLPLEEEWNCTAGAHVRRAAGAVSVVGTVAVIPTANATLTSLFKSANITYNGTGFGTPAYPNSNPTKLVFPDSASAGGRTRRSWLGNIWHHIVHGATTAWNIVRGIGQLVVTGDADVDKTLYSTDITMGPAPCLGRTPPGETQTEQQAHNLAQCQFHAGLQIVFQLQISHYHLDVTSLYAEGEMHGDISTNGQALDHTWSGSQSFTLFNAPLFSISIPVAGIPLPIKLTGALYSHPQWSITGDVTVDSDIHTSGELKFGVEYTPATGARPVRVDTLLGSADLNSVTGVFTVDGSIEMDAVFELTALYVASASVHVEVTPSFTGTATETVMGPGGEAVSVNGANVTEHHISPRVATYGTCQPTENAHDPVDDPSFRFSAALDVDVTAGADIDVTVMHHQFYNHQFNFGSLYSHDWTFGPWCRHIQV